MSHTDEYYKHVESVKWPDDLQGPYFWTHNFNIEDKIFRPGGVWSREEKQSIKDKLDDVEKSAVGFYDIVKQVQGEGEENNKLEATRALLYALDCQDELAKAAQSIKKVMLWLQDRRKNHITSMQAVVITEEGELYDLANHLETWNVKLEEVTNDYVDYLRFIFRMVMARIDIFAVGHWVDERIQPAYKEAYVQPGVGNGIRFPRAHPSRSGQ